MSHEPTGKPLFVLLVAGFGCFLLSFVMMGLAPWTSLRNVVAIKGAVANPYIDPSTGELTAIGRGRKLYIKEACWHCHSQFTRPVAGEPYRYGPASQAWESVYDVPHTYGTRRIGPDLSRESGRHSDDWHYAHLYNPRGVVPLSIMPGYPWFFIKEGGRVKPKQEAQDLVSYLQYLGSAYKTEIEEIVYPRYFQMVGYPRSDQASLEKGKEIFQNHCVGCHGHSGNGQGQASPFLNPKPANLVDRYIMPSESYSVLNRGVKGSAMPSFREMPEKDLWSVSWYVALMGENTLQAIQQQISSQGKVDVGKKIFLTKCSACHGVEAKGDGPAAASINPRPKDLTKRVFVPRLFNEIVRTGISGSAMPGFQDISDEDLLSIQNYLLQFFKLEAM